MGKSIRSKTKKHFRTIKREEVFKATEDARLARLAEAQAVVSAKPMDSDAPPASASAPELTPAAEETDAMMTEISTPKLTKAEREKIMLTKNQYKRKQRAQSKSRKVTAAAGVKKGKGKKKTGFAGRR
ncbi:hypothetical protein HDU67_000085 [Dinochytrium kinnereticum]|nr:hypothetical protein HDU67_000085 [Dinochytrium kinnereticum]